MRHKWITPPAIMTDLFHHGRRKCVNCGAEQTKEVQHLWMRVTGYRWEPLVGRCKPKEGT